MGTLQTPERKGKSPVGAGRFCKWILAAKRTDHRQCFARNEDEKEYRCSDTL